MISQISWMRLQVSLAQSSSSKNSHATVEWETDQQVCQSGTCRRHGGTLKTWKGHWKTICKERDLLSAYFDVTLSIFLPIRESDEKSNIESTDLYMRHG